MKSKTIILSSQEENMKGRGILTLFQDDDLLECRLRLYNTPKLSKYCKIGVYHNNQVSSANLLEKNGVYTSSLVGDFNIDADFYTAIVDTEHNNKVIISGGTYAGYFFNDENVFQQDESIKIFDEIDNQQPEALSTNNIEDDTAKTCDECDKCVGCKYKEFFYSQEKISKEEIAVKSNINKENEINQEPTQEQTSIIQSLIPQFQYVFENYDKDETLTNLIPNSKFVTINENQEHYSIGAIYEMDEMKYICYAVLCNYNTPAPKELGEHYQWLPLDKEDPLSEGYYIVFQDAKDLKIVDL